MVHSYAEQICIGANSISNYFYLLAVLYIIFAIFTIILWHVDLLPDNDREIRKYTTAVAE
jgi:hypothetical protein